MTDKRHMKKYKVSMKTLVWFFKKTMNNKKNFNYIFHFVIVIQIDKKW